MPIQDKVVTIRGTQAVVNSVTLHPQADGSVVLTAFGTSKDAGGALVQLGEARLQVSGVPVIDNLVARALIELRKANGLE